MEQMGLRCMLSWDMGLGKTIATLGCLHRNPQALPAIVVCPASVKYMWESEAARFGIRAAVAEGQTPPDYLSGRLVKHERLLIINYDILRYWLDALKNLDLRTVIFDECQFLGTLTSRRTQAAMELARPLKYAIALSGTPLTNRPAELWPTLHILRPDLYNSFWLYACEYCEPRFIRGEWQYKGATKLKKLNQELQAVMIRRKKSEVLHDLPGWQRRVVPVPIRHPEEYKAASDNFLQWLRQTRPERVFAASRAEQVTRVGYLLRLAARLKMRFVADWIQDFLQRDEKLVMFAVHKRVIRYLQERFPAESVVVDGSVVGRKRKAAVDQFRRDRRKTLFIGNIKAAGTGIDGLQDVASTVGFAEMWWVPGIHTQAEARVVDRIGQRNASIINYFVARGTIEEKLCKVIQTKQKVIDETLDGDSTLNSLDVFDQFVRAIM